MSKIGAILRQKKQFLLYCACGGTGVATDYLIYYFLIGQLGLWYQGANAAGYIAGTLVSFALNRIITFNTRDQTAKRLALFLATAAIGYGVSAIMLWTLVRILDVDPRLAKLVTLPVVVLLQFTLNKRVTFSRSDSSHSHQPRTPYDK